MRHEKDEKALPDRCRLVLITPPELDAAQLVDALAGGDVASLILLENSIDEDSFQAHATKLVAIAHERGVAVMLAGEPRMAMRIGADGIHVEGKKEALRAAMEKHSPRLMVGAGGISSRDDALELGETQPDYVFFGRFGFDRDPAPHPRNLTLAAWWSQMVEIPCILQGGSSMESALAARDAGADFVALSAAVFGGGIEAGAAVARVNALLDGQPEAVEEQR